MGKPLNSVRTYAEAFWDENFGKQRFSEHEYERVVKLIEKGEKKIEDIKGLQRGTKVLISLFDNPWIELQFTHVNCKDKKFTAEEDRFLLCWAHKVSSFSGMLWIIFSFVCITKWFNYASLCSMDMVNGRRSSLLYEGAVTFVLITS